MNKIELKLTNYKKHKELEAEFQSGNLYLVTGSNNIGKTSVLTALSGLLNAKDDTKNPVTFGETKGRIEAIITNKDGENTDVIVEYERNKSPKFKLIYPDTKTSTKPTDIREAFKFNDFTVDEFFSWGHTAEGRKKQAEIFLSLIQDKSIVEEIEHKSKEVSIKGELYKKRTNLNSEVRVNENLLKENKLTLEEIEKLKTKEKAIFQLKEYKDQYEKIASKTKNIRSKEAINNELSLIDNNIETKEKMILQLQEEIKSLKESKENLTKELGQNNDEILEQEQTLAQRIKAGEDYIGELNLIQAKEEKYNSIKNSYDEASKKAVDISKTIEQYRKDIKDLFEKANYPVKNITIDNGEAYYLDNDNNKIPFVESDLSYSVGGSKVVEILMELNKNLPIILLGKASEFDKAAKDKFSDLAKEKGYIIIADHVVENQKDLQVTVWDLKEKSNKKAKEDEVDVKKPENKKDDTLF